MAKGKRSMAHDGHSGRNAPAATPPRMTADSLHVSRRTSSRRARSAVSGAACATALQMDSTVSRSAAIGSAWRSEEHTSELQSHSDLVCRLLLEKKKKKKKKQ